MSASHPSSAGTAASWPGWAVHLLTASGAVIALLALEATMGGRFTEAFLWLALALLVDGIDGTLARAVRVRERVPRIDGEALDLIIDYLNYVLVPSLIIWRADLLPAALALPFLALVQLSSLYVFARRDMKTADGYFRGFPALWNVVALYLLAIGPEPWVSALVVALLAAMSFAPILFVHPFRSRGFGPWPALVTLVWAGATIALLIPDLAALAGDLAFWVSTLSGIALLLFGLVHGIARGRRGAADVDSPPPPS